jgi:23S rRNA (cytidine1920-2'-O)/16S rRNA (cytidine1409-2'-O)-methyltransferase
VKLAAALDRFGLDVTNRVCLDVGASTGGFTEVLLARGARRIYAVDVGNAQLHPLLRGYARIVSIEDTDIRTLDIGQLGERSDMPMPDLATPDLATVDVSFISLKLVLPAIGKLLAPRAQLLALVKPQFEAGRREVKKGIVRDAKVHDAVCEGVAAFLVAEGWRFGGRMASPIPGGDGNQEFFIEAERG